MTKLSGGFATDCTTYFLQLGRKQVYFLFVALLKFMYVNFRFRAH